MECLAEAEVLIVGGGIAGCSIAYHLSKLGCSDVVLCERKQLTSGTTWHAAGLVTQLRATRNMTELAKYTGELFLQLETETGQATGYRKNGSLRLAKTHPRFEELRRGASMARNFGLEASVVTPGEVKERWPLVRIDDLVGAIWMPNDGQVNPADVTMAMAKGARRGGVRIIENNCVRRILIERGKVVGATTDQGVIRAAKVVIAGGMWSRELAAAVGVSLPLHAAEHFYVVTEPIERLQRNLPVLFVADECSYYKEDAGKLLVGFFEPRAKPWGTDGIPDDFCFDSLPPDTDHIEPLLQMAAERVPAMADIGIKLFFNGPESFTPDDRYLLGETAEVRGLYCACGFNSVGILSSGGVGKALAHWIINEHPPCDLADVDVRRFRAFQSNKAYLYDRTTETLGLLYQMHWPYRQYETARNVRRSPFHDRLIGAGACMTEAAGWERPGFFTEEGVPARIEYSYGRQNWFDRCAAECRSTASAVTLFDQSSFTKFHIQGRDACSVLNLICAGQIDVEPGRIVYTQLLNARGGIEADVTVTRIDEDSFLMVSIAASHTRDLAWLGRHVPEDARATVTDVTSGWATLGLMGPRSRALLETLAGQRLPNDAFPFGRSRELAVGYAKVRASRITYVGELGWELYIPTEFAQYVHDQVAAAGRDHELANAGYFALNSLRMEKGYRHWGHDIGDEDTPLEAGLGFAVDYDKPGGFIGRDALLQQRDRPRIVKRLVQIRLLEGEGDRMLYHDEPIWRDGVLVGSTTSGAYGHRIGASLAMGYVHCRDGVDRAYLEAGSFEVEIACERYPVQVQLRPFYDPDAVRVKAA